MKLKRVISDEQQHCVEASKANPERLIVEAANGSIGVVARVSPNTIRVLYSDGDASIVCSSIEGLLKLLPPSYTLYEI
jgi:hypothetical protein